MAEALRLLKESKGKIAAEICAVSNVQEEVGLLGARQIAYSLKPDIAVVVDVTHATDYPTVNKAQHGDIKIGQGPALTHGGCNHPEVVARLESVAKAKKFRIQHEAMSASSSTTGYGYDSSGRCGGIGERVGEPAEPVYALARRGRQLERFGAYPGTFLAAFFAQSLKAGEMFKVKI